jgi:stage III sporulation protein SpoIIIAA
MCADQTTVLREVSRLLSLSDELIVTVVDKSLEISGVSEVPHQAIGNARVLTVGGMNKQAKVMVCGAHLLTCSLV